MMNRRAGDSVCTIVGLAIIVVAMAPAVPADGGESYTYYYFKQEKALRLDTSRIAVFDPERLSTEAIEDFFESAGYRGSSVRETPVRGWSLFELQVASDSPKLVENLRVSTPAEDLTIHPATLIPHLVELDVDRRFYFAPVFDSRLGPVIPSPTILVRFQKDTSATEVSGVLSDLGMGQLRRERFGGPDFGYKIETNERSGFGVLPLANRLARHPSVIAAEPDMLISGRSGYLPNDPQFLQSWGLYNYGQWGGPVDLDVDATEAWDRTFGDGQILTAIIDTGVQPDHPDLRVLSPGVDTTSDIGSGEPTNVCDNHGTPVAGVVASIMDNGVGTAGVAPETWLVSARTFISNVPCYDNEGKLTGWHAFSSWTVETLDWAYSRGVRVTNNSNDYGGGDSIRP